MTLVGEVSFLFAQPRTARVSAIEETGKPGFSSNSAEESADAKAAAPGIISGTSLLSSQDMRFLIMDSASGDRSQTGTLESQNPLAAYGSSGSSENKLVSASAGDTPPASSSPAGAGAQPATSASLAVEAFLDYMNKTPAERYYDAFLAEEGLTKEQLEALPPEQRAEIEAKIQKKVEERMARDAAEGVNESSSKSA